MRMIQPVFTVAIGVGMSAFASAHESTGKFRCRESAIFERGFYTHTIQSSAGVCGALPDELDVRFTVVADRVQ